MFSNQNLSGRVLKFVKQRLLLLSKRIAPLRKEGIGNKTNFYSLEPVREVFNSRRMAVSFHKSKNRENCRRNVFVRLKTPDSSGIIVLVKSFDLVFNCQISSVLLKDHLEVEQQKIWKNATILQCFGEKSYWCQK